ncbi:MAG: HupE/UreJ family protein [Luteimonas sp.]|nr:HupE/UreJ family protein [Luteimonas sp.]
MIGRTVAAVALALAAVSASAHTLSVSHLDVTVGERGAVMLELDVALRDMALTLPLDANRDEAITWGELSALRPEVEHWAKTGLEVSSAGKRCALAPSGYGVRRYDDGTYASLQMTATCTGNGIVDLRYDLLFGQDPQHRALVTMHRGTTASTAIASPQNQVIHLAPGSVNPLLDYLREGIHHILIGYDHLAFLISLLLPAALIRRNKAWQPAQSLRASFLHVLGIVTAFTVAHSLTLSLAALGWITPASRPVEAAIAASVLLAALNNLWPIVTKRIWAIGFAFGLIHGFGFAGALSELGLPMKSRLLSLIGFNLGVEVGQLLVVAVLLPVLYLLRRQRFYSNLVMPVSSLAVAGLAAWWLYQRILG